MVATAGPGGVRRGRRGNNMARTFSNLIESHELQFKITRDFMALAELDRDGSRFLLKQLNAILGASREVAESAEAESTTVRPSSSFHRVIRAFVANGNAPMTKAELSAAASMPEATTHSLVYSQKKDHFDRVPNPAGGRERAFKLNQATWDEFRGSASSLAQAS